MEKNIYECMIQGMSDGIMIFDSSSKVKICNRSAMELMGYEDGYAEGKSVAELMKDSPDNDEFFELILDAIYSKKKAAKTLPFASNTGMKYINVTADHIENTGIIVSVSDITDIVELFISNKRLANQVLNLMRSFVEVIITAVEENSQYNANHTKSMVKYTKDYLNWLSKKGELAKYTNENTAPLIMSVWLHDMGKLLVPKEIIDKPDRLGNARDTVMHRIETALLMLKIRELSEPDKNEEITRSRKQIEDARELILDANKAGFLSDEKIAEIRKIARIVCLDPEGNEIPLLNDNELEAMTIPKGTLTAEERKIVQSHVVFTSELLKKMKFRGEYKHVPQWAGGHHEFLDGSGYPDGLRAEDLSWETRLLTIIDIYDALTADDRPYKPPVTPEKAFCILRDMCDNNKLDRDILESFYESGVWDRYTSIDEEVLE